MKKSLKVLSCASLLGAAALSLASCSGDDEEIKSALNAIIFNQTGEVKEDFTVVKKVRGYDVAWSSSDTSVINFADKDANYNYAVVTRPDTAKNVTLTAKIDDQERKFEVSVNPVDVYEIADSYSFAQDGKSVFESFQLDTKYDYKLSNVSSSNYATKTATMVWSSSNTDLISINENGFATVNPTSEKTTVKLTCKFTYDGVPADYSYDVNVYKQLSAAEQLQNAYNSIGETVTLRGWVVAKDAFAEKYGNTNVYMVHESKIGGFYAYRVKCTKEVYDQITIGTGVKATLTVTDYKGLIESSSGSIEIDSTLEPVADINTLYQAVDKNVIVGEQAGVSNIKLRQSSLVTLTGWKVKEVGTASATADTGTQVVLKLEKNGVGVSVAVSKYLTPLDGTEAATIIGYQTAFKAGDIVNVKGLLGYYSGYQVLCQDGSAVTAASEESTVDVSAVTAAIKAVKDSLPATANSATTINKIASTDTVKYEYTVEGKNITATDSAITITPTSEETTEKIIVVIKANDLEYTVAVDVKAQVLSNEEAANAVLTEEAAKFEASYDKNATVALAEGVTAAVKEGTTAASVAINGSTITITPAQAKEDVTLVLSYSVAGTAYTKEVTFSTQLPAAEVDKHTLTAESLFGGEAEYAKEEGGKDYTYNGIVWNTYYVGNNGDGIQMKAKVGAIYNKTAFAKAITGVSLKITEGKTGFANENYVTIYFANNAEFTDAQSVSVNTQKNVADYTVTVPAGSYTYIKIVHAIDYTAYFDTILINFGNVETPSTPDTPTTPDTPSDATKAAVAYNAPAAETNVAWGSDVTSYWAFPTGVVASAVVNQGTNTQQDNAVFTKFSARIYAGSTLVLTAADGYKFIALTITYDGDSYSKGTITVSEDGKTITITPSGNKSIRVKDMELSYTAA